MNNNNMNTKMKTTTTPYDLCYALHGLTDAQKSDIRDMGFQSLMSFSIERVPTGLARWLLLNYDHKRNELNVGSHVIEITPSKVRDVLGLPMGKIPVYEKRFARKEDAIRIWWRKQSFRYPTVIFVKNVVEKLKSCTEGGTLFRLNFLVVFNSVIGGTTKSGIVSQTFLSSIRNEDEIRNMDWCSYIVTCLKRSKAEWSGKEPYNGPLTFLATLYAHEQQLTRAPEKAITPAIRYVTTGFLVDLVPCLIDNNQEDNHLTKNDEVEVKLQAHIESVEGQNDEDQTALDQNVSVAQEKEDEAHHQIDEGQTDIDQTVNVPQDEDQFQPSIPDYVLNLRSTVGPLGAQSPSGLSANLVHYNGLELPRHKKLQDDDDVVMLEPKQEKLELVENVSHMSDSVEKFVSDESGVVCVEGYKVKQSVANILKAILEKHGDIAANCLFKTDSMRSSILEAVCEVAMRIQANDVGERVEDLESRVSDAKAVNIDVSWLEAHIQRRKDSEMYSLLMKKKEDHLLAKNAAEINLRNRQAELAAAEERSREAKRRVRVLHLVGKNLTKNYFESKAKMNSWVTDPIV